MRLRQRNASLAFIFITIAIDAIGLGIVIPVMPDVIRRFIFDEALVSRTYGYFIAIYALLQFTSSPVLGGLSDRFGRRPILLIALLGAAIDYAFMAYAPTLFLLFVGRVISGISGASFTVASAYIADISNDQNRSKNFGVIGAGFGLGFVLGPALGGWLAQFGSQTPFLAAAGFNFLNFLFGFFVLPESLAVKHRRKMTARALNPFRSLKHVLSLPAIQVLLAVHVLTQLAGQTHPSIWTLYTQHRYGWNAASVGLSLAVVGILSAFSQGVLTGVFVKRFGERKTVLLGCLGEGLCFALFGLAFNGPMLYAVLLIASIFWSMHPALQALISRDVPDNQQGELQGSLMSLTSLTSIVNPLIMTSLFAAFSNRTSGLYLPGAPYFLGCALLLAAWLLLATSGRAPMMPKKALEG